MFKMHSLALLAAVLPLPACGGLDYIPIPPLTEIYTYPQEQGEGEFRAEINRIRIDSRMIMIYIDLVNDGTEEIRFEQENVLLEYHNKRYTARDFRRRESDIRILPGQRKDEYWAFHVMERAQIGEYILTIRGISIFRDGEDRPLGKDLAMPVTIPIQAKD